MSSTTKNFFMILATIVIGFLVLRWVLHLAISLLIMLLPLAIVGGGLYLAYQAFGRKALGGGRRTLP